MLIGPAQVLTCPYCGEKKLILSLRSGNTFGAKTWSDTKMICPMLPTISSIQKCPNCGKYYFKSSQEVVFAEDEHSNERGTLCFSEIKEALCQFATEGFSNFDDEATARWMVHHAFNDYYYRENNWPIDRSDKALFKENALWLINNVIADSILKAEFYREIGMMDEAKAQLASVTPEDSFHEKIVEMISTRIENNDRKVFLIS